MSVGQTYDEQRFSPLTAINDKNVGDLGLGWYYDLDTMQTPRATPGRLIWRFWTVPGNPALGFENNAMELASKTWSGTWWTLGRGGTVWDSIVYDSEFNRLYFGTGNGTPWAAQAA